MDPEKLGINIGLKNMSDLLESSGKCKSTSSVVYAFQVLCIIKNKINVSSHQIQPANNVNRQI